jgi:hypothetical protein
MKPLPKTDLKSDIQYSKSSTIDDIHKNKKRTMGEMTDVDEISGDQYTLQYSYDSRLLCN